MIRREFIRRSATGFAAASIPFMHPATDPTKINENATPVRLGVASYSLRNFSRADAIKAISTIGADFVSIKSMHLPYEATPDEIRAGVRAFTSAGIHVVGGGVIYLQDDSDDAMRPLFEYARTAGFPLMTIGPTRETLPRIERFVREYNIPVAIHNHGPEDEVFPAPSDAMEFIRDMDPRIGVCVDVGHTARTGHDVVGEIRGAGSRLFDMHIKDLSDLSDRDSQVVVGQGAMPVPEIFAALSEMSYAGYVNLEYEIDPDDPVAGMQQSFAYMRGVLAGLGIPAG